jgi:tetratricopeptide (TPR) repeat protein
VADFDAAIRLKFDEAEVYNDRGVTLHRLGRLSESVRDYDEAIKRKPTLAKAWLNRGIAHLEQDQIKAALGDFAEAVRLDPAKAAPSPRCGRRCADRAARVRLSRAAWRGASSLPQRRGLRPRPDLVRAAKACAHLTLWRASSSSCLTCSGAVPPVARFPASELSSEIASYKSASKSGENCLYSSSVNSPNSFFRSIA